MRGPLTAVLMAVIILQAIPTPGVCQSTIPAFIRMVGTTDGAPDPSGQFSVVVRDVLNNPVPGALVRIDFSACTQVALAAPDCTVLTGLTDATGTARFTALGSVLHRGAPQPIPPCASITADGAVLGNVRVSAFDQDGVNGVRASDVALVECDLVSGTYHQRSDFNADGLLSALDLSLWAANYYGRGSTSTAARCDGLPTQNVVQAPVGGLGLRWGDCSGGGGVVTRAFACAVNTGSDEVVASLVAPAGITSLMSFEAEVEIIGQGGVPLADWWRVGTGACHSGGLQVVSPTGTGTCDISGLGGSSLGVEYPTPPSANYERVRVFGVVDGTPVALVAGTEYEFFRLRINHTKSVGAGSCAGCNAPVRSEERRVGKEC